MEDNVREAFGILKESLIPFEREVMFRHLGKADVPEDIGGALMLLRSRWKDVFRYYLDDRKYGRIAADLLDSWNSLSKGEDPGKGVESKIRDLCTVVDPSSAEKINVPVPENKVSDAWDDTSEGPVFPHTDSEVDVRRAVAACIRSAEDMLIFDEMLPHGDKGQDAVVSVTSYAVTGDSDLMLRLEGQLSDTGTHQLVINGKAVPRTETEYPFYDRDSGLLGVHTSPETIERLGSVENPEIKIVSNLSFLIENVVAFYKAYGNRIGYADKVPVVEIPDLTGPTPSQREAVKTVLGSKFAYIWGAPGTGKTQMVLATSLVACMKAGERVAIVAPTNLAVEQVLRGLVTMVRNDPSLKEVIDPGRDIIRLGTASDAFLDEFPEVCENRSVEALIEKKKMQLYQLSNVPYEREIDHLIELTEKLMEGEGDPIDILRILAIHGRDGEADLSSRRGMATFLHRLRSFPRSGFSEWTDEAVELVSKRLDAEIDSLFVQTLMGSDKDPHIVACTPHVYISRFVPRSVNEPFKRKFMADRIFLDEAGYCSAMLAMTLMANRVPLILLGDHMQLPPVCPVDEESIAKVKAKYPKQFSEGLMEMWYLWDLPSTYIDTILCRNPTAIAQIHKSKLPPLAHEMQVRVLRESYRFGKNLAEVLDRIVYHNGITGASDSSLDIRCIDVSGPVEGCVMSQYDGTERIRRVNTREVEAIVEYMKNNPICPEDVCILTPYSEQVAELKRALPEYAEDSILTVHRSQGREWNTVILSVQDGEHMSHTSEPLRFTSSKGIGLNLINTAVSRAKKHLVIVCDRSFWMNKENELVTELIRSV